MCGATDGFIPGSLGTTWGNVFVAPEPAGSNLITPDVIAHEEAHSRQWAEYGEDFLAYYSMATAYSIGKYANQSASGEGNANCISPNCYNVMDVYAGLMSGNYAK